MASYQLISTTVPHQPLPTDTDQYGMELGEVDVGNLDVIPDGKTRDDKPIMNDLHTKVIHKQFAVHWKRLGLKLGLSNDRMEIISYNHKHSPNRAQDCCTAMFVEWLRDVPSPTWGLLSDAIIEIMTRDDIDISTSVAYRTKRRKLLQSSQTDIEQPHSSESLPVHTRVKTPDPLSVQFNKFVNTIEALLEKCHDKLEQSKRICLHLTISDNLHELLFNDEQLQKINACSTFNELFTVLRRYWSLLDYSILKEIITTTDVKEAKDELQLFQTRMGSYEGMKIISENIQPDAISREYITLTVIVDKPYRELTSEDFIKLRDFIFKYLDIKHYTALPHIRYLLGSLHLKLYVLKKAAPHMIKMAQQNEEIFTSNSVVFIQVDQYVVFDYTAKDKTMVTKKVCPEEEKQYTAEYDELIKVTEDLCNALLCLLAEVATFTPTLTAPPPATAVINVTTTSDITTTPDDVIVATAVPGDVTHSVGKNDNDSLVTGKDSKRCMRLMRRYIIPKISKEWDTLADFLDYPMQLKINIKKNYSSPRECCTALLEDWVTTDNGVKPKTWEKLIEVLSNIEGLEQGMEGIKQGLMSEGVILDTVLTSPINVTTTSHITTIFDDTTAIPDGVTSMSDSVITTLDNVMPTDTVTTVYSTITNMMPCDVTTTSTNVIMPPTVTSTPANLTHSVAASIVIHDDDCLVKGKDSKRSMILLEKYVISKISDEWEEVAVFLDYSIPSKNDIKKLHKTPRQCCTALLEDWFTTDNGVKPKTWEKLIEVLSEAEDLKPVINEIKEGLMSEGVVLYGNDCSKFKCNNGDQIKPDGDAQLTLEGTECSVQDKPDSTGNQPSSGNNQYTDDDQPKSNITKYEADTENAIDVDQYYGSSVADSPYLPTPLPRGFIVYIKEENDPLGDQVWCLSKLLYNLGIICEIDLYCDENNIDMTANDWEYWVENNLKIHTTNPHCYVILVCSPTMISILDEETYEDRVEMVAGYIDSWTLRQYLQSNPEKVLPVCINDPSNDNVPLILSENAWYHFPYDKLYQMPEGVSPHEVLNHPEFASFKRLVSHMTGHVQQLHQMIKSIQGAQFTERIQEHYSINYVI